MTTPQAMIPRWTLADRLWKARKVAGLAQFELAEEIGISRATVINVESGKSRPTRPVMLSWALRCGVPLRWLETGEEKADDGLFAGQEAYGAGSKIRTKQLLTSQETHQQRWTTNDTRSTHRDSMHKAPPKEARNAMAA